MLPEIALDQGSPSEIFCNFHLSFYHVPQVLQKFRFTHGTPQRMESQISWTAMCQDSTHQKLKSNCWRMERRWMQNSQTCLSARTGVSIFWSTLNSLPMDRMNLAAVWSMLLSKLPRSLNGSETTNQHHGGLKIVLIDCINFKCYVLINADMLLCFMLINHSHIDDDANII